MDGQDEDLEKRKQAIREKELKAKSLSTKAEKKESDPRSSFVVLGVIIGTFTHSILVVLGSMWVIAYYGISLLICFGLGWLVAAALIAVIPKLARPRSQCYFGFFVLAPLATALPVIATAGFLWAQSHSIALPDDTEIQSRRVKPLYMDDDPGYFVNCKSAKSQGEILEFYINEFHVRGWRVRGEKDHFNGPDRTEVRYIDFSKDRRRIRVTTYQDGTYTVFYRPWRLN